MKTLRCFLISLIFMAIFVATSPLPVGSKFAKNYEYILDFQNYTLEVGPDWEQCRNETGKTRALYLTYPVIFVAGAITPYTTFPKWDSIVTYCHQQQATIGDPYRAMLNPVEGTLTRPKRTRSISRN